MKVYDCFTFFNELDLLEIRLKILDKSVDHFVIVEGDKTHKGKSKEYIFEKYKSRFKKWSKKIIYIKSKLPKRNVLDKFIIKLERFIGNKTFFSSDFGLGNWKLEQYQRNEIIKGIRFAKLDDLILISDLDEIPSPFAIQRLKREIRKKEDKKFALNQKIFLYYLNGLIGENWIGTKAVTLKTLLTKFKGHPQRVRIRKWNNLKKLLNIKNKFIKIENGGWHFSYIRNLNQTREKLASIVDGKSFPDLSKRINSGRNLFGPEKKVKYIKIDNSFPKEIIKNIKKYKKLNLIKDVSR